MEKTFIVILVTSAVWICILFFAMMPFIFPQTKDPRYDIISYQGSSHAKWIYVPDDALSIHAHFYGGFDTNYTAVMFTAYDVSLESMMTKKFGFSGFHNNI